MSVKKPALSIYVKIAIVAAMLIGVCYALNLSSLLPLYDISRSFSDADQKLLEIQKRLDLIRAATYGLSAILLGSLAIEFFKKRSKQ